MKKIVSIFLAGILLSTALSSPLPASAATKKSTGLSKVCRKVIPLGYHVLYKFQASGHLATTDRASSCSMIFGPGSPTPASHALNLYDKNGKSLSVFREYTRRHGNDGSFYNARFYTYSPTCGAIAALAKKRTHSTIAYVQIDNRVCYKLNTLYGRQGAAY